MFRSDVAELSEQFTELEKKNSQAVIGIGPDLSLHYRSGSSIGSSKELLQLEANLIEGEP